MTEKIKIFVDAHTFDNEFQGSRTFIRELYAILSEQESLELYLGAFDTENLRKYFPVTDRVHFIRLRYRSPVMRLLFDIPLIIRKYKIRYAHFQYIVPLYKNCRYIVTIHDVLFKEYPSEFSFFYRFFKTWLYRMGAKKADILTVNSPYSKKSVEKYLDIPAQHIHLVRSAVHERYFKGYDKEAVRSRFMQTYGFDKFILYVSRIEPRKNHLLLLQVFLDLALYSKGYRLVLIGHNSISVPAFEKALQNLPEDTRKHIIMLDGISEKDILDFYRAATVFVCPSKAEGLCLPPLEAAACQTPVICSNASAMSDFYFLGKRHINPAQPGELRQVLEETVNQPPDQDELMRIAMEVKKRYSWQYSADTVYKLIMDDNNRIAGNPVYS